MTEQCRNLLQFNNIMLLIVLIITLIETSICENYFAPSIFFNHDDGLSSVLGEQYKLEIAKSLQNFSQIVELKRLKGIILITSHRIEQFLTISSGEHHNLVHDNSNITFEYNAPGDPVLAERISDAMNDSDIRSILDSERGWDLGVFSPMKLINPSADIPIVQMSIVKHINALLHYTIGEVLYQFRNEGIAVFGSGSSYHNLDEMKKLESGKHDGKKVHHGVGKDSGEVINKKFDDFLTEVCTGNPQTREKIIKWQDEPGATESQPYGGHLTPYLVTAGAGGSQPGKTSFNFIYKKIKMSGCIWDKE